jgi:hypothetical protein
LYNTYIYMYFCNMQNRPKFIQLSISTDNSLSERYFIIAEIREEKEPRLHIIPLPDWLVFYSEKYPYYCINLN